MHPLGHAQVFTCMEYYNATKLDTEFCDMYVQRYTDSDIPISTNSLGFLMTYGVGLTQRLERGHAADGTELMDTMRRYMAPVNYSQHTVGNATVFYQSSNCQPERDQFVLVCARCSFHRLGTTGGLGGGGWAAHHPVSPPPWTPPPPLEKIGPNFLLSLRPIKIFLWRFWRQLVSQHDVPRAHWDAHGRGSRPLHHLVSDSANPHDVSDPLPQPLWDHRRHWTALNFDPGRLSRVL